MDTLIKIFRKRGYDIEIKNRNTYIIIAGEEIQISCREKIKRTLVKGDRWQTAVDSPTGLLTFNLEGFHPKQWIDGKQLIEDQIPQILDKLIREAERLRIWHLEIEENHKIRMEIARVEKEKEQLRQKDFEKFLSLVKASDRFQKAKEMLEYVDRVEEKMNKSGGNNEQLNDWIQWAKKKIEWYDPIIDSQDPNLDDIDKDTLTLKKNSYF